MSKWRQFDQALTTKQASQETKKKSKRPLALVGALAALIVGVGITAYAANERLNGHVTVTDHRNTVAPVGAVQKNTSRSIPKAAVAGSKESDLVNQYGAAADSPAVAAAIRKAESAPQARQAADRYEALQHGIWKPGADPMLTIMHGYVPPNMEPHQAQMLYSALPHFQKSPRTGLMTPEMIEQLAGGPPVPSGFDQESIRAANQQMIESHMRQRFGPVYVPPLHRPHTQITSQTDNQMSLIQPQYSVDEGNGPPKSIRELTDSSGNIVSQYRYDAYGQQTKIAGSSPDADFGYAGMYVHQRSGLLLAPFRAYKPSIGRWLSRDPIQDPSFKLLPRLQEQSGPSGPPRLLVSISKLQGIGKHPNQLNPYTYVANNPVNLSDPSGLAIKLPDICKILPWLPWCKPQSCPSDPGEEYNECLVRCNGWGEGTPEWEECMYNCLAGYP